MKIVFQKSVRSIIVVVFGLIVFGLITGAAALAEDSPKQSELAPGVTAQIKEIRRTANGSVMTKFLIKNDGMEGIYLHCEETKLVDLEHKKVYHVMEGSGTSTGTVLIAKASEGLCWAHITAPPPEVSKVDLQINRYPPIEGVEIH